MGEDAELPPSTAIFEQLLGPIDCFDNLVFRRCVSVLVTALKRSQNVLVSHRPKVSESVVIALLDYILTSLFPMTISVVEKGGAVRAGGRSRGRHSRRPKRAASPFLSNICIVESIHETPDVQPLLDVMHDLQVTIDGHVVPVPDLFLVVALVPETVHLPKTLATAFVFHINIPSKLDRMGIRFPDVDRPLFGGSQEFAAAISPKAVDPKATQTFMHKEVSIYLGRLILKADCTPLVTSFIDVTSKLYLTKAIEDSALLNGRAFVTPDDVQLLFPCLVTHRVLLPGPTTFQTCVQFADSIVDGTDVPV
jgi:MoxR-like ATPase